MVNSSVGRQQWCKEQWADYIYTASVWLESPIMGFKGTFKFLIRKCLLQLPAFPFEEKESVFLIIGLILGLSHAHRISMCISLIMFYDASLHRETIFDISTAENHIFPSQVSLFVIGISVSCSTPFETPEDQSC